MGLQNAFVNLNDQDEGLQLLKPCGFKFQIHGVTYPNVDTDSSAINKKIQFFEI